MSSTTVKETYKHKETLDQLPSSNTHKGKLGGSSCDTGSCWYSGPKFCWVWIIIVAVILIALIIWLLWWLFGKKYGSKPLPVNPTNPSKPLETLNGIKCQQNSDCPTDQVCINSSTATNKYPTVGINASGVCGPSNNSNQCKTHNQCLNTQYCHSSGECLHKPLQGRTIFSSCNLDTPCLPHLQCDHTQSDPPSTRYSNMMENGKYGVCRGNGLYPITEVDQVVLNDVKYGNVRFCRKPDGVLHHNYNNSHTDASKISFNGQNGTLWFTEDDKQYYLKIEPSGELQWSESPVENQFNMGWDINDAQMFYVTDRYNNISCHKELKGGYFQMIFTDTRYYSAPKDSINIPYYGTFRLIKDN